jgi:hypothetical protein
MAWFLPVLYILIGVATACYAIYEEGSLALEDVFPFLCGIIMWPLLALYLIDQRVSIDWKMIIWKRKDK